ncbi:arginine-tRNA-protein transferase [Cristinia sonorae]|uniref:Arginyl-tRNA--protein transferase 1 n=1 Tax=Cristinia sonorae TaxID=1940300 RepID=A0A8K0UW33_9AGAR|nr:arginine-tRNA-protein transferase [Cristinia sonorae]
MNMTSREPSRIFSILSPLNPNGGTCGYCSPPGERSAAKTNLHDAECIAEQLSCQAYQAMIDRGWRRSGTYLYKPDMKRTCCPQYTIRLDSRGFKASKSQRKMVNRFNRFIIQGDGKNGDAMADGMDAKSRPTGHPKGGQASQKVAAFELESAIHAAEEDFLKPDSTAVHKFEVTLEPSSFTEEKFALYQSYQREIHREEKEKNPSSFKRFLVESPLVSEDIAYTHPPPAHLPRQYGSYHQLYRLDGKLVAVGVIDILPTCVSSVYFMYEKEWEKLSLGKMSALREISLANEIRTAGALEMGFLYMGYYIHTCQKMRYKGDYSPSYLADPEDYTWHPLEKCIPLLEKNRFATFSHPEHSIAGDFLGPSHDPEVPTSELDEVKVFIGRGRYCTAKQYIEGENKPTIRAIMTLVDALGLPLAQSQNLLLYFKYVIT